MGAGLMSLSFFGPENLWFMLGLIPVMTGMMAWCPVCEILRVKKK
jgi:hypothetical protein